MILFSRLVIFAAFLTSFALGATLVQDEVETLREIGNSLRKKWDFSVDPCSQTLGWSAGADNNITCDCTAIIAGATVCHVTGITLRSQNLAGTLPKNLSSLPYLQSFDVTRNYLSGSIPPEWGSSNLVRISLLGNRLTGPIPKEIGSMPNLTSFVAESNQLSGVLPPELGNLSKLSRLLLNSNSFTGELNTTFAKLTSMAEFRIGANLFTGRIPQFITEWRNLTLLSMQGSGLIGPIPSEIGQLSKMKDLRISDINGTEATFPRIDNMTSLVTLIFRSCNIVGPLPDYLGRMTNLKTIDLSFNKLNGEIPEDYSGLREANYIFLTGNSLSGEIPLWILQRGKNIDLSYNNFTAPTPEMCQQRPTVNLFKSSFKGDKNASLCFQKTCPLSLLNSVHINCGGKSVTEGNITYEDDTNYEVGPSKFYESMNSNWALSSTGYWLDYVSTKEVYILPNETSLVHDSQLYMNARISPLSLTYYLRCLVNGKYIVSLHFAEIKFTNDSTYSSLGRRIFDVYIQDVLVLKDFNIEDSAGGVGKIIIKNNYAIVNNHTLEIRLFWTGKGTTAIPTRGVYGPLISAISVVNPDYKPPKNNTSISVGAVVGIVVGVAAVFLVVLGVLWWKCCKLREPLATELRGLDLQTGSFTLRQIKAATNNFDSANKIGEGGFGPVYKGLLSDGVIIAVKQLSSKSKQGNREFLNEIGMISALQHPHLVKLYGCCVEGNQLLLVYEYMENNSLAGALFGSEENQLRLDWATRLKICIGIARGLAYLHEESRLKIVHRDIKATNVLLDKNLNAKISDFGLAKLDEEDNTHISTRIAGTYGYMAPEYALNGYLTDKADVYSFGIVALEIVSGRSNTGFTSQNNSLHLLDWALELKQQGCLIKLVDPKLGDDYNEKEIMVMINVGILCTNEAPEARPNMSSVVSMLEGKASAEEIAFDASIYNKAYVDFSPVEDQYQRSQERSLIDSQVCSDGPWTGSSASDADLYRVMPNSDFLQSRV